MISGIAIQRLVRGLPVPLAVSFVITNRCNYKCAYCDRWRLHTPELSTSQVLTMVHGLRDLGMHFFQITGGEPFLRQDLGVICKTAKALGLYVGVNTNGSLLKPDSEVLKFVDRLTFSLDGPREVHETARPRGSFDDVMRAIEVAQKAGVKVGITTTITRANWAFTGYMADLAARLGVNIAFQPAFEYALSSDRKNTYSPEPWMVRRALAAVRKSTARDAVTNDRTVMALMSMWPRDQGLQCAGGRLFFRIETNGDLLICGIKDKPGGKHPNILLNGLDNALQMVPRPDCTRCYNHTRLKVNMLYTLAHGDLGLLSLLVKRVFLP